MKTKGDKYCDTGDYKNAMKRSEHGDADAQKHHRSNVVTGVELDEAVDTMKQKNEESNIVVTDYISSFTRTNIKFI